MNTVQFRRVALLVLFVGFSAMARAQDLSSFEKRVSTKALANGLTVIVCERRRRPFSPSSPT